MTKPQTRYEPAVGTAPVPPFAERTGEPIAKHERGWRDARWSYLFRRDSAYANVQPAPGQIEEANRRGRGGDLPEIIRGPMLHEPPWTWEIPLYFWLGGISAGSSFVALACDLASDDESARTARMVALAAVLPCPVLLILDLGRPLRFLYMLRIFKPRSPMSTGAWCLVLYSSLLGGAVGADLLGLRRLARRLGGATAVSGGYLGSYTGVLLAATAVPVWARSRLFLGPIFISTATATGAAACRLVLAARGLPVGHPTRRALGTVETIAMGAELAMSTLNERQLGPLRTGLELGRPGRLFKAAKLAVNTGLVLRIPRALGAPTWVHHVASALYLTAGLLFRFAWVGAGKISARDDRAVAQMHRDPAPGT